MKDLEKRIAALWVDVAKSFSPAARDVIAGIGQAFDPAPREYRETFVDSDIGAFTTDLEALYLDWCAVHHQLRHMSPPYVFGETYNFHGRPAKGIETRKRGAATREREHA